MLLYHWTLRNRAERIRQDGFVATTYDAGGDGVLGVWVSENPESWKHANEVCLVLDVPEDLLQAAWKVTGEHAIPGSPDWRLPPAVANEFLIDEMSSDA